MSTLEFIEIVEALKEIPDEYQVRDISTEEWREYVLDTACGEKIYRIDKPLALVTRQGGTTHRIVDDQGITHCLPAGGPIRWCAAPPVSF